MMPLTETIQQALTSQLGSGVLVLSLVGSAFAFCRTVPGRLLGMLRRQFIVSVDVVGGDPLFAWLTRWMDAQPYSKRTRALTASGAQHGHHHSSPQPIGRDSEPDIPPVLVTPAPGEHVFWYAGRPVWLSRERKEINGQAGEYAGYRETLTLRMLGRSQASVRALLEEARLFANRGERRVGVYVARYGDWMRVREMPRRPLDSVVLPPGVIEELAEDAQEFMGGREWYEERGIPWRRGYLLEGPPGTGKTSAITALAAHLRIDLYICPVSDRAMSDERLMSTLLSVPERSAVLLEDVDGMAHGREMQTEGGVTFSGLLNALDGVASRPGVLTFLTTNHPELLDDALVRDGRVDVRRHFALSTAEQAARLFSRFYSGTADPELARLFGAAMEGRSMSSIQGLLMQYKTDPSAAVRHATINLAA